MKRKLFISLFFFLFINSLFADDFTELLQDLAIQTACIGQYSSTQAGGGWYDDPCDYYTPKIMAERFKNMSGERTRTTTFYGICFDYAQEAWNDIKKFQYLYNDAGMKNQEWYIAGVENNSYEITLFDPVDSVEKATDKMNGVYLKKNRSMKVMTHKAPDGKRATNHAWLWVLRNNGVWYWIDPTWTDNLGYPVFGYVSYDGEEIQLTPDNYYCVIQYPKKETPKTKPQNNYTPKTIEPENNSSTHLPEQTGLCYTCLGYIGRINSNDTVNFIDSENFGLELSCENATSKLLDFMLILSLDYLTSKTSSGENVESLLIGSGVGFSPFYIGTAIGVKRTGDVIFENIGFAWKVNGGIRISLPYICAKFDISYGTILGPAAMISFGITL